MKKIPPKKQGCPQENAEKEARRECKKETPKQLHPIYNKMSRKARDDYKEWAQVLLPDNFCLADNYDRVVSAINNIRTLIGKKKYINFSSVRQVDTAAALMLAAELEISKIQYKTSQMMAHDSDWDPKVRPLLEQMGFLELLSADSKIPSRTESSKNQIFIKFRSRHKLIGDDTMQILESLQKHIAPHKLEPEFLIHLYVGIFEAITNTRHHAYNNKDGDAELNRWWISASADTQTNEIKIVCYDRGETIPKTIQNSRNIFSRLSDGEIIIAAVKQKIFSTQSNNRGRGLSELLRLIDTNQQGVLRIYSGMGMAEFKSSLKTEKNPCVSHKLSQKMRGTLVEWRITPSHSTMESFQNDITY